MDSGFRGDDDGRYSSAPKMSDPEISLDMVMLRTYHELFGRNPLMEAGMATQQTTTRSSNGRFAPGCSGNPAGKKKGTRNRATLLAEALRDGEDVTVARVIIDKALAGDAAAARFCIGLLSPKPRGREITIELPETAAPNDVVAAFDATFAAMAAGEITPDEALTVTKVLDGKLRARRAKLREAQRQRPAAAAPDRAAKRAAALAALSPPAVRATTASDLLSTCISQAGAPRFGASSGVEAPVFHLHLQPAARCA
jgi:hypothetical protein